MQQPQIEYFTAGKSPEHNEDCFGYDDRTLVIADGATDKSGRRYSGRTGGEIVAKLVVETCLKTDAHGTDLVHILNAGIADEYRRLSIDHEVAHARYRMSCSFICVRISDETLHLTSVGDCGWRLNGTAVVQSHKLVDEQNAAARSRYIKETGDIAGSRDHIMPLLMAQFSYQNDPSHVLGYGVLDGTVTPEKYIETHRYPRRDVHVLEMFTDGYVNIPTTPSIAAWEEAHQEVEREDPDKFLRYPSTKSHDDRTIAIIRWQDDTQP